MMTMGFGLDTRFVCGVKYQGVRSWSRSYGLKMAVGRNHNMAAAHNPNPIPDPLVLASVITYSNWSRVFGFRPRKLYSSGSLRRKCPTGRGPESAPATRPAHLYQSTCVDTQLLHHAYFRHSIHERTPRLRNGGDVAARTFASHNPDVLTWCSCRMMALIGGFSWDLPFQPPLHSGAVQYSPRFTLIGSEDPLETEPVARRRRHGEVIGHGVKKGNVPAFTGIDFGKTWKAKLGMRSPSSFVSSLPTNEQRHHGQTPRLTSRRRMTTRAFIRGERLPGQHIKLIVSYAVRDSTTIDLGEPGLIIGVVPPDFRTWDSCRTMTLVDGFSRGYPVSPALAFRWCSVLTSACRGKPDAMTSGNVRHISHMRKLRRPRRESNPIRLGRRRHHRGADVTLRFCWFDPITGYEDWNCLRSMGNRVPMGKQYHSSIPICNNPVVIDLVIEEARGENRLVLFISHHGGREEVHHHAGRSYDVSLLTEYHQVTAAVLLAKTANAPHHPSVPGK
ncbi:hypothetical protein PR048_013645 [Dryococelus australis]|uniref:Uncharacterized protein n=1 Tax=Dryococelus australis TaxID=614101 RepID=A0ABQ9HSR6_9NEOP|nr:hypothetical protein PR048_013645 [Dryococelus australis]